MKKVILSFVLACACLLVVQSASAQCLLSATAVSTGGPNCGGNCNSGNCDNCATWDISTASGTFTDIRITTTGNVCFQICSATPGWTVSRNDCSPGPVSLLNTMGQTTIRITICSNGSGTFNVTSLTCGGTAIINT